MKVMIVGSGGREHALCWAIAKSPLCDKLYCAPGNAGISSIATCLDIDSEDLDGIVEAAESKKIGLVVIGPEGPLVAGLADRLEDAGIKVFGVNARAAKLEGSKAFMKDMCAKYGIPTAEYEIFNEPDAAKEHILRKQGRVVVKADGLASGKGVILCHNQNEGFAAIDQIMTELAFGASGNEVVIEDFMKGEEASFFALVDGERALPLVAAQDHKAVNDGDKGPNTGGMGAYTPAPIIDEEMTERVMDKIITPMIKGMAAEGRPYKGVLFAGLMINETGPNLLEINVRFGDPECQPLVMRLKSDLLEALLACTEGRLDEVRLKWRKDSALVVVMATQGYPGYYEKDSAINGLEKAGKPKHTNIFHAGTKAEKGKILADGGRVLGVTSFGKTVSEAQKRAYRAVGKVDWPDGFCRSDIGWRAVKREE